MSDHFRLLSDINGLGNNLEGVVQPPPFDDEAETHRVKALVMSELIFGPWKGGG